MCLIENSLHVAPVIPQVVHHSPLIGKQETLVGVLQLRLARTDGEDDGSAALVDGIAQHGQLVGVEGSAHVVHLDEVDAPLGIEVGDAVVVELTFLRVLHKGVVLQPCAGAGSSVVHFCPVGTALVGGAVVVGSEELVVGGVRRHAHWHASHDVDAELHAHGVDAVGECLEAFVLSVLQGAGETRGGGQIASVFVNHVALRALLIVVAAAQRGVVAVPAYVHYHVFPAIVEQVFFLIAGVLEYEFLVHGAVVAVPRVPSAGRSERPFTHLGFGAVLCVDGKNEDRGLND